MDLVALAEDLLAKAKRYAAPDPAARIGDLARLREDIRAVTGQISYALDGPDQAMHNVAREFTTCTALRICADLEIAEWLEGDDAQSLGDLSEASGCDPRILRPVMRILAQHGIFQQRKDGKWQHTTMSLVLTKPAYRAWMNSILEEKYKSTVHLPDFLKQRDYAMPSTGDAAYNAVFNTPMDFYTFANEHDHPASLNFAVSMQELARVQLPFVAQVYPLEQLDPNTHFVDVAGGIGNMTYFLAKRFPQATFEVQDHKFVLSIAQRSCPESVAGRVKFRAHDMFQPQPLPEQDHPVTTYLLKIILHDHDDVQCRVILHNLLAVMGSRDRILIIETVLPEVGGSMSASMSDILIMSMFGCGHRTADEWQRLFHGCEEEVVVNTFEGGANEFDGMAVFEVLKSDTST